MPASPPPSTLSPDEARRFLVGHHGLCRRARAGAASVRALLRELRCIQLDPLDVLGSNADLVVMARIERAARGDVMQKLFPGHAFEHFAKERCLLPPSAFPYYRDQMVETPWWRLSERLKRLPAPLIDDVLAEVRERGPIAARELGDRGAVKPLDWSGWKGTGRATAMALEVLATRCQVVVAGRAGRAGKIYDVPERALPTVARTRPAQPFARWAVLERVEAAGLLARAGGATWSMLSQVRTSGLLDELIAEGAIEEVVLAGQTRRYLAPAGFRSRKHPRPDGQVRILGPLDPVLWDRALVKHAFGFDYVWEVYKPAAQRRWGWYVCPILEGEHLVGRLEGAAKDGVLTITKLWREAKRRPSSALDEALATHAMALGAERVSRPKKLLSPG